MIIRKMKPEDWDRVFMIYKQGIDSGKATFTTEYPTWDEWDSGHNKPCRYVAVCDNGIVGIVAVSPTSGRSPYRGVVEVTIYVDENHWNKGIGTLLLKKLIQDAPDNGFWCLYSSILSSNENSINLHKKCGFRTIGYREKIAKDKFGNWLDTTVMEYRFPNENVKGI